MNWKHIICTRPNNKFPGLTFTLSFVKISTGVTAEELKILTEDSEINKFLRRWFPDF